MTESENFSERLGYTMSHTIILTTTKFGNFRLIHKGIVLEIMLICFFAMRLMRRFIPLICLFNMKLPPAAG